MWRARYWGVKGLEGSLNGNKSTEKDCRVTWNLTVTLENTDIN